MKQYRVEINLCGYATIFAKDDKEAQEKTKNLSSNEFNWEPFSQEVLDDALIYLENEETQTEGD